MKIKYKEDKKSLSPSYSIVNNLYSLNSNFIKSFLKKKCQKSKIARACLHKNKSDKIHQMIIFQKYNYYNLKNSYRIRGLTHLLGTRLYFYFRGYLYEINSVHKIREVNG